MQTLAIRSHFGLSFSVVFQEEVVCILASVCSVMPLYYSETLVKSVNDMISASTGDSAIIASWKKMLVALKAERAVTLRVIHPLEVMCHPKNRGGLMLNGFRAHVNANRIMRIGANRDLLAGACAIKVSPFPYELEVRMHRNQGNSKMSNGLMAAPDGNEKFMSVGTSE